MITQNQFFKNNCIKLIPFVLIFLSITACNKAKNKKWLFANIEVRDANTDELIDADIELHYRQSNKSYNNDEYDIELLGTTTDGYFSLEKKFPEKIIEAYLFAYGRGYYYSEGNHQQKSDAASLSTYSYEDIIMHLHPIYRMELSFENVNCFDATDSLFFTFQNYFCHLSDIIRYWIIKKNFTALK